MSAPFVLARSVFNQGSLLYGYAFKGARSLTKLPVADGETITRGMFVGTIDDEAVEATDASDYTFVGVAASNPFRGYIYVWRKGFFKFKATGISGIDIGVQMYVKDSDEVDNSALNSVKAGRLVKNLSNTSCWIELNEDGEAPA